MDDELSIRATIESLDEISFDRPMSRLSTVGVLTVISSPIEVSQIRIDGNGLVIGRGDPVDGIDLRLPDENVSRCHARIRRIENRFVIEDLRSRNGTFVDGIPIRSLHLHDGDEIQIGRSRFYFDRLIEFGARPSVANAAIDLPANSSEFGLSSSVHPDLMTIRFWGTRGSIPTPGFETSRYGGNTTCLEVNFGDTIIVIDAGSGIREMSKYWSEQSSGNPLHVNLLFTHLHWDHIQGFPFFGTAYQKGNSIDVYGARRKEGSTKELLSGQMQGAYFPIPISAMQATLNFHETESEFAIGPINVQTYGLPHPGGSLGYRFRAGDSVFVLATDCEFDTIARNQNELKENHLTKRQFDPGLLQWMGQADVLVIDCQYTDAEYQQKAGWGHNSIATIVDLCDQVRPRMVGLFHHDPMSNDVMVTQRVQETAERLLERGIKDTLVFGAREKLCLAVQKPKKPSK